MTTNERAVSPVVAVALLITITVILAAVIGATLFGLGVESAEAPEVTLSFEVDNGDVILVHEGGEQLEADEIAVLDEAGNELDPGLATDLSAGEREPIADAAAVDEIQVVWQHPQGDTETILATFKV